MLRPMMNLTICVDHRLNKPWPLYIEDIDGKTYIDYIGSWGPNILGHAPVVITNTIHEVAKSGVSFGIPNPYEVEMARTITEWVPSVEKVRRTSRKVS